MSAHGKMTRTVEVRPLKGSTLKAKVEVGDKLGILDKPNDKPPAFHGCLRIMTEEHGDERYTWDRRDFSSIKEAAELFDKLVAEGLVPYRVGVDGRATSEVMVEFDPLAEEVVFLPIQRVVGG